MTTGKQRVDGVSAMRWPGRPLLPERGRPFPGRRPAAQAARHWEKVPNDIPIYKAIGHKPGCVKDGTRDCSGCAGCARKVGRSGCWAGREDAVSGRVGAGWNTAGCVPQKHEGEPSRLEKHRMPRPSTAIPNSRRAAAKGAEPALQGGLFFFVGFGGVQQPAAGAAGIRRAQQDLVLRV